MANPVMVKNQIPKNWQKVKLGDVCYSASEPFDFKKNERFVFVNTADIKEGNFINRNYFDEVYLPGQAKKAIKKDDILYSEIRPKNKHFAYVDFDADEYVVSTKLMVIRSKENVIPNYLYLLLTNRLTLNNFQTIAESRSGTFPQLTFDAIANYDIMLPQKEEQLSIVNIASSVDDKIEINNKIAKTLEEMAQALFKEWFIKNALPGWETSKFENYARLEYGKALQKEKRIPGKVLVFGSSGQVGTHNEKLCSGPGIVVGRKGNVGSVFWINENFYPIDTTFYVKSKISIYYIYFVLKNMRFHTGDSAVPGLNRESVHSLEILVPDEHTLKNFENIVSSMFKKLAEIKKENQKLAAFRDLLLPKLMKGEIRV